MSRRMWLTVVLTVVMAAGVIRFGAMFPWAQMVDVLANSNWELLAAASVVNIISVAAKAAAWYLLLRRLAPLGMLAAQVATFAGAAVNTVSVSVSGEATRAQLISARGGLSFGAAVTSLIVTRVVEAAGLVVFLCAAFIVSPPWPAAREVGFVLCIALVGAVLCYHRIAGSRLRAGALRRGHDTIVRMMALADRGTLAGAVALATLSWLAQWVTYHWSILATHAPVTPAASLSALVMTNIAGTLRLTPSNVGVTQGSLVLSLRAFGIPAANGLAAGLALQAVQVLPILVIGTAIVGRHGFRQRARVPAKAPGADGHDGPSGSPS